MNGVSDQAVEERSELVDGLGAITSGATAFGDLCGGLIVYGDNARAAMNNGTKARSIAQSLWRRDVITGGTLGHIGVSGNDAWELPRAASDHA